MRRQRIISLHRKHTTPPGPIVFLQCEQDPDGMIRDLDDIEVLQIRADVEAKHGELFQFDGDFRSLSLEQIGTVIRNVGKYVEYGPIRDPANPYYGKKIVEPLVEFLRPAT